MLSDENPPPPSSSSPSPLLLSPTTDPRSSFSSSSSSSSYPSSLPPTCLRTTTAFHPGHGSRRRRSDDTDHHHLVYDNAFGRCSHGQSQASSTFSDDIKSTNFSIRDFVFAVREKDISTSWPFSPKHLQLCLNNGVKCPLPPFQVPDSLTSSTTTCLPRRYSLELAYEQAACDTGLEDPLVPKDHLVASSSCVSPGFHRILEEGHSDLNPTATDQQGRDLEIQGAATSKHLSSAVSGGKQVPAPGAAGAIRAVPMKKKKKKKTTTTKKKKCMLILKLGGNSYHKSPAEDITSTSEGIMATKICPVCQTFSSSSNTTLNAHIDQCLSATSPSQWPRCPELPKPRIKPRKIRLMSDIYATARHCTLEHLYGRNGTEWAVGKSMHPPLSNSAAAHGQIQTSSSSTCPLDRSNNGAVYMDANGTKIRILSLSNDISSGFKVGLHTTVKKIQKKCGGSEIHPSRKKKLIGKHVEYLKLTPHTSPTLKACSPADMDFREDNLGGSQRNPLFRNHKLKVLKKREFSESFFLPKNEIRRKCDQHSTGTMVSTKENVLTRSEEPLFNGTSCVARSHVLGQSSSQGIPRLTGIRSAFTSHEAEIANEWHSWGRTRRSDGMLRVPDHGRAVFLKASNPDSSNLTGGNDSLHEEADDSHVCPMETEKCFPSTSTSSGSFGRYSPLGLRVPSASKCVSLLSQETVPARQLSSKQKDLVLKKNPQNVKGNEFAEWPAKRFQRSDAVQVDISDHTKASEFSWCTWGKRLPKVQARRGLSNAREDGDLSEFPETTFHSHCEDEEVGIFGYSGGANHGCQGHFSCIMEIPNKGNNRAADLSSNAAENLSSFSVPEFHMLAKTSDKANPGQLFCSEESFLLTGCKCNSCNKKGMFSADDIGVVMMEHEATATDFDPVPIPGPPGSYLPSPRHMEFEVLQGNSSFSTSCKQISNDPSDVADIDSYGSPVSALSSISNFTEPKSAFLVSGPFRKAHPVEMKLGSSGFLIASESHAVSPQLGNVASSGAILDVDGSQGGIDYQRVGLPLQSRDESCSWSGQAGIPCDAALNFLELQNPKRHLVNTASLDFVGKRMDSFVGATASYLKVRTETSNPVNGFKTGHMAQAHSASMLPGDPSVSVSHSMSPSTSVLRLMGQDLMVVNSIEKLKCI